MNQEGTGIMKRTLKWIGIVLGVGIASAITYEAVQRGREQLRSSLSRVDRIAEKAEDLVHETHAAVHDAKQAM